MTDTNDDDENPLEGLDEFGQPGDRSDPIRAEFIHNPFEYYYDRVMGDVPKIPANELCNARKSEKVGKSTVFRGYCNAWAGFGRDTEEGRCKFHNGPEGKDNKIGGYVDGAGAPKANQNATTTGLNADPSKYAESLNEAEKEFVANIAAAVEDRMQRINGSVDFLDKVLAHRIAVQLEIACQASGHARDNLIQTIYTEDGQYDKKGPLVDELRQYDSNIISILRQLGLLDDPETKKADALQSWRQYVDAEQLGDPEVE